MNPSRTPGARVRCETHGLHYDPALSSGCVLCRKEGIHDPHGVPPSAATPYQDSVPSGFSPPPGIPAPGALPGAGITATALRWSRGVPAEVKATPSKRLVAALIDGLISGGIACLGMIPVFLGMASEAEDVRMVGLGLTALLVLGGTLGFAIYQWVLIAQQGQTVGKRAMQLRIVKQDGSAVGFVDGVILRSWVIALGNQIVPFLGLIDVLLIFTQERRCLHDLIATTDVIDLTVPPTLDQNLVDVFR